MYANFILVGFLFFSTIGFCAQFNYSIEEAYFPTKPELEKHLDEASRQFIEAGYFSGGVNMVAYKGNIIYQKAFGRQSIEEGLPMQLNSLFRIASMCKPFTTVAVLLLVEEGKIKLDDPAEKYLPQFSNIKVLTPDGRLQPPKQVVTIRHLLMHTSGTRSRSDEWYKQKGINCSAAPTLEEYVDLLLQAPLVFHPGEGFNYAMNNDICARIVEIITQQNYGDFLNERIFKPLEMNSTWFVVPENELGRLCSIYAYNDGVLELVEGKEAVQSSFPRGNGQMVSTAGDYMNFLQMLMNGGVFRGKRIISEETLELMTEDRLPPSVPLKVGKTVFPNTGFGLSVAISRNPINPWKPLPVRFDNLFQHLPKGCYLWPGITNTYFWADPERDIAGVVLTQSATPGIIGHFQAFTQTFYHQFFSYSEEEKQDLIKRFPQIDVEREKSIALLVQSLEKLQNLTNGLSEEQLNFQPAAGRWSIKNNVEHLVKVEELVWDIMQKSLDSTEDGLQSDITDEELLAKLINREKKYTAPEVLQPVGIEYASFKEAIRDFKWKRYRTIGFVKSTTVDLRKHFAKNPVFGQMDTYQWTLHVAAHCLRHIEQIEEVLSDQHYPKS